MKYALITGPTSGIGYYLAHEFAKQGIPLVLIARDALKLQAVADEFRGTYNIDAHGIVADLSHETSAEYVFQEVTRLSVSIGYLINNAGVGDFAYFKDGDVHTYAKMMTLNMHTPTLLTKYFLPQIIEHKGKILNIASTAAFQPGPTMAVYYATKAYILSWSEALREELRGSGVTVTTLCPGPTASEFQKVAHLESSPLVRGRKLPSAEDVAHFGFESMMGGKGVVVHGLMNKVTVFLTRWAPRTLLTRLVQRIQGVPPLK